ncbi:hypothetical protein C8J56DRAFT_903935 [Mycena floridula]|nr:hypothetical protein C8J56DRAFT_903935 [Mycena floridula]
MQSPVRRANFYEKETRNLSKVNSRLGKRAELLKEQNAGIQRDLAAKCDEVKAVKLVVALASKKASSALDQLSELHSNRVNQLTEKCKLGHPYVANEHILLSPEKKYTFVPVWYRDAPLKAYTVIRAQVPNAQWVDGPESEAWDHHLDGYKSTVGPVNFHYLKHNMVDSALALASVKRGRPPKRKSAAHMPGATAHQLTKAELMKKIETPRIILEQSAKARARFHSMYCDDTIFPAVPSDADLETLHSKDVNPSLAEDNVRVTRSGKKRHGENNDVHVTKRRCL